MFFWTIGHGTRPADGSTVLCPRGRRRRARGREQRPARVTILGRTNPLSGWCAPRRGGDSSGPSHRSSGSPPTGHLHGDATPRPPADSRREVSYFRDYARRFTDLPLLVTLRERGDGYTPDRFLTATHPLPRTSPRNPRRRAVGGTQAHAARPDLARTQLRQLRRAAGNPRRDGMAAHLD